MSDLDKKMENGYSEKYNLMIHFAHSCLQHKRERIEVHSKSNASNFRESESNDKCCVEVHKEALMHYNYELSLAQMSIAINLLVVTYDELSPS